MSKNSREAAESAESAVLRMAHAELSRATANHACMNLTNG